MRFSSLKYALSLTVILLLTLLNGEGVHAQCADSIDLATWITEGDTTNGDWQVTNGGNTVNQTINGDPTFYVSPDSFINVIITGDIQVATTNDNDWVGFVFGYIDPDTTSPNNYDFYLFDWKQQDQNFGGWLGQEGYSLSRFDGPITNFPQAFSSKAGPFVNPIANNYGNTLGWNDLQTYSFALTYTNTRVVISIDGDTIFDVYGCFPPGRFGFYNYSQSNVNYSNFSYRVAAAFEVLTPNVCLGDTAKFIALSDSCENAAGVPVNNTLTNWYWDFGDGSTSTDTNGQHLYTAPGVYQVFLEVTDYLGCTDTAYSSVEIYNIGTNLGNDTNLCVSDSIVLDAGTLATSYIWSTGATSQTLTVSDSGTYSVTVSNIPGCVDSDTVHITLSTLPIVDLGPDTSICNGDTLVLYSGNAGATLLWNTGATIDSILVNDSGTFTVSVTYPSGCSNSDTVIITNYAQPVVTPPNPSMCSGDTITVTATGASTYAWSPPFGISATTGTSVDIFTTVDTSYSIIGTDTNGCTDTSIFTVNVFDLPTVAFGTYDDSICSGDSTLLRLNLTGESPWDVTYVLNTTDTFYRTGLTNATDSFYVSDSGMYVLTHVSNGNCDVDGFLDSVHLYLDSLPAINIASISDSLCTGDTLSLTTSGATTFNWFPTATLTASSGSNVGALPTANTTYFAIGQDNNGCIDTGSINVEVLSLPVINVLASPAVICLDDTVTLFCAGAQTYSWEQIANGTILTGDSVVDTPQVSTPYLLTGTDQFGCSDTTSIFVQVDSLPDLVISPTDTTFCKGDTAQILVSAAVTYTWQPALGLNATTGATNLASPDDTTTYTISGTDGNGCIGVDSFTINIRPLPPVLISALNNPICFSDTDTLAASGAMTYVWTSTYNIGLIVQDSVYVYPDSTFDYIVQGTDSHNCTGADTFELIVDTLPNILISTNADSVCKLDSTELIASGAVNYEWEFITGLSSYNLGIVDAFPHNTSTYTVTGTDANGCQSSNDTTITVIQLPVILAAPNPAEMCVGESIQLTLPTFYSYLWTPLDSLTPDMNNGDTALAFADDTTLFTISATDSLGCMNDTTFQLAVTPLPIVSAFASDSVICPGTRDSLSAIGANSYFWSPNYKINNAFIPNPIVRPDSTTDYIVTGTGPGGCQSTDTITVYTYDIGPFSAGNDTGICKGDTIQLSAFGGVSYQWSPPTSLSDPSIPDPSCFSQFSRFYEVSITDSNGCVNEASVFLTVNSLPQAKAGPNDTICEGDITTLGGSPSGPPGALYLWSPVAGLIDTSAAPRPDVSPDTSTTYTLLVTDTNGCQDIDRIKIIVTPLPTLEIREIPDYVCLDDTGFVRLTAGLESYNWVPSTGIFSPNSNSSLISPPETDSFTVSGTDTNGCTSVVGFNMEIKALPTAQVLKVQPICDEDTINLRSEVSEGSYSWSPSEFVLDPDSSNSIAFPPSPMDMKLTVTDEFGCEKTAKTFVTVYPLPYADAGEDIENCNMQVVFLGGEVTAGIDDLITWSPVSKVSNAFIENPRVISTELDTFYLKVESPEGCISYDTAIINSDCQSLLYAPNAFTPDNDQINDSFRLYGHNIYDYQLEIFDQWGHLIFQTNDITFGWDGNFEKRGNDSPINTFFWRATYRRESGRQQRQEGHVTLIR